jgi:signal transduction histidine kinase
VRLARLSAHVIEVAGETCVLCSARDVTTLVESEAERARAVDALLSAEESIRANLAVDLHDDTLQVLAGVSIELQRIENTVASAGLTGTARAIQRARGMLNDCADRTRGLMFQLRPRVLADAGLGPALAELARALEQDGAPAIVVEAPDARYGARIEELVWRTVREALVNVRRHASAKHVTVTIEEAGGSLEGEVRDDGVGFDTSLLRQPNHVGVDTMRERIEMLGGRFAIHSTPGTTVRFQVPLAAAS